MKKILCILTLILLIALTGCDSTPKNMYTTYVADKSLDPYASYITIDDDYCSPRYFEKSFMRKKTCEFDGVEYSGEYVESCYRGDLSSVVHTYETKQDDGTTVTFDLREDNGALSRIVLSKTEDQKLSAPDVTNPKQNAIDVATSIASRYINVSNYNFIVANEYDHDYTSEDGREITITDYTFKFVKQVYGYDSSDYIEVLVNSKGQFIRLNIGDINAFDNLTLDFEKENVTESIHTLLENGYAQRNCIITAYNLRFERLAITPEGFVCVYTALTTEIVPGGNPDNEEISGGFFALFTVVGKI